MTNENVTSTKDAQALATTGAVGMASMGGTESRSLNDLGPDERLRNIRLRARVVLAGYIALIVLAAFI